MGGIDEILKLLTKKPLTTDNLAKARGISIAMRIVPTDIDMALMFLKQGNEEAAISYIYGPTNRGTGKGAIADFEQMRRSLND